MSTMKSAIKIICDNRKARHEYDVLDTIEAGIVLEGHEIKSIVKHLVSLDSAYANVHEGEVFLVNSHIEYGDSSKRTRKLLLHKKEIRKFAEQAKIKGFTLVPLSLYLKDGRAKIDLALCKGRQLHDKRQAIKERELQREMKE